MEERICFLVFEAPAPNTGEKSGLVGELKVQVVSLEVGKYFEEVGVVEEMHCCLWGLENWCEIHGVEEEGVDGWWGVSVSEAILDGWEPIPVFKLDLASHELHNCNIRPQTVHKISLKKASPTLFIHIPNLIKLPKLFSLPFRHTLQ